MLKVNIVVFHSNYCSNCCSNYAQILAERCISCTRSSEAATNHIPYSNYCSNYSSNYAQVSAKRCISCTRSSEAATNDTPYYCSNSCQEGDQLIPFFCPKTFFFLSSVPPCFFLQNTLFFSNW